MIAKLFHIIIIISGFISNGSTYTCYECNDYSDGCYFVWLMATKECTTSCYIAHYTAVDGMAYTKRGCTKQPDFTDIISHIGKPACDAEEHEDVQECYLCSEDLCNRSIKIERPLYLFILAFVSLSLII
ncbi:hypothetical protein GWI33_007354 [Rhynchophorus ferrugineus]|uniref:Protein quiver n=1 Tax=Rhynchophorus ferrugineus TaxID=354439 RepID=A0A834IEK5_RHYFE|nr:hypothetical protein GWI33_007354 [Rhynchophorus ferrugineus]